MGTLCLFALLTSAVCGQDKKPDPKKPEKIAINDPAKLKDVIDYRLQGEAVFNGDTRMMKFGMQSIARGNGDFVIVYFEGGLPGSGWNGNISKEKINAVTTDGKGYLISDVDPIGSIDEKGIWLGRGKAAFLAKRVERKSPTLGAEPPKGAIVLFSKPEDISKWEKMSTVKLSDGEFLGVGGRTKQKFQSFTLHLEFRLPWMPNSTGQQRGNSGVYIQDRYEIQVLDSFGLKGEDNECGGIYKESKPKANMCFPPMVWQTYDIDFTAATFENGMKVKPAVITVKHNGVVIHDKLELKSNTPGGGITKETPEPGAISLQNHGDQVVFRNIWIVEK